MASVRSTVQRAGLMGQQQAVSVKAELDTIRTWHVQHGYKGGLVVRDLTLPLGKDDSAATASANGSTVVGPWRQDPLRLARRECYYLYYEVTPTGQHVQQIFCRGTTLWVDVWTCLQANMVYEDELGCRVHSGFWQQARRILHDVEPLLVQGDQRAEIEVCGHSLGGATAALLAIQLRLRGYTVTRVTTIGEPAYVATAQAAAHLATLLPVDHLRIEDSCDFVPFLPPFGSHVGNKLWFHPPNCGPPRFVKRDRPEYSWTESVWINFSLPELLWSNGAPHRIPSYLRQLATIVDPPPGTRDGESGRNVAA